MTTFLECIHGSPETEPGQRHCASNRLIISNPMQWVTVDDCASCSSRNVPNKLKPAYTRTEHVTEVINAKRKLREKGGPCKQLGELTGNMEYCNLCGVNRDVPTSYCSNEVQGPTTHSYKCLGCSYYNPSRDPFVPQPTDPSVGVVIGSYHWPKLVALQILLIRDLCGPVPVLVHDDCTDGFRNDGRRMHASRADVLYWVCRTLGADLKINEERRGHLWGDTLAFRNGVTWAKEKNIKVLAKLSQRFLVLRPRWLQKFGKELLDSGKAVASQMCRHKNIRFAIRTEACLVDVDQWYRPDVMHFLSPESGQIGGENTVGHVVNNVFGGRMHRWRIMTKERHFQYKEDVLWHHQDNNDACAKAYHALAARYGITLDDDFQCGRPAGS